MRWQTLTAVPLFFLAACATVNYTPYEDRDLAPTTEVEVLQGEPTRAYRVLGEMWVPANDTKGVLKMRKKAMEVGADAIVLLGQQTAGAMAIPLQGMPGGAVALPMNRTYAVAIRYER